MGEKGNLLDVGEEIFTSVAEQGPQLWLDFKEYQLARGKPVRAKVAEQDTGTHSSATEQPPGPATR
jgi:hypothetical protein